MPTDPDFVSATLIITFVAFGAVAFVMFVSWMRARTRAEAAEERFLRLFEMVPTPLTLSRIDASTKRRSWIAVNDAFVTLSGKPREALLGSNVIEAGLAEGETWKGVGAALDRGQGIRQHRAVLRVNGALKHIEYSAAILPCGGEKCVLGMATDITALARTESDLLEVEKRFRQITDSINEVFWLCTIDGSKVLYVSPSYEKVWGRTAQSLYDDSHSWLAAIHEDDHARVAAAFARVADGAALDVEYRLLRPDGNTRSVRARGVPVRDATGKITRVAGVAEDVTDHKKLEEEVRQAQKLESIGRLAGGVAHDFNNLLTVMSSSLAMLDEGEVDQDALDDMHTAVSRAVSLTRQLLAFSRRTVLDLRAVDLNGLVADTEKMLRRLVGEHIEVQTQLTRRPCVVRADAGQLVQVMMNLAVNARDAMPDGGKLTFATDATDDGRVVLTVADNGCGMSAAVHARIFEPFFTTKPAGTGTGLGLSVIHGIVAGAGGHIDVDTVPGKGTTFRVTLPPAAAAAAVEAAPKPSSSSSSEQAAGPEAEALTILVVEDEEAVRSVTARILKSNGFHVLQAANGADALDVLSSSRNVDVALLDVVMPGLCGRALGEAAHALRPALPIVYVSGYNDDEVVRRGIGDDADGTSLLQKPWSQEALLERIQQALA